tara:strand:- start:808 stop:1074 length:267 start_codon:yes stop_codon:yes gene_type:complete
MGEIIFYIGIIIFFMGLGIMSLGLINFVKNTYPTKGRLGLAIFYLIMAVVSFKMSLGWVAWIWVIASVFMMIDLKIYEMKQKKDDRDS